MHTVTLAEVLPALDTDIILASSCDSKTRTAKDMKYNPGTDVYTVRLYDFYSLVDETVNKYSAISEALDKYNSLDDWGE